MSGPPPGERGPAGEGRKLRQLSELPVSVLKGVGERARQELGELGIESVLDLVTHYPRRYIDGTRLVPIADLAEGDKASVLGRVTRVGRPPSGYGRGRRRAPTRVVVGIADDSGQLDVVFFNQAWRAKQLAVGTLAMFYGTVGSYRGVLQLSSPTAEVLQGAGEDPEPGESERTGRVYPVYPLTDKAQLTSARIGRYVGEALDRAGRFADPVPPEWRSRFDLVDRTTAFGHIHRPTQVSQARTGPPPAGLRRAVPPADGPGPPPGPAPARRPRHPPRDDPPRRVADVGGALPGRPALRAHRGPGPGHRRHPPRPGRSAPDAPAAPGRRRARARRWWRWRRCWPRWKGATRGR